MTSCSESSQKGVNTQDLKNELLVPESQHWTHLCSHYISTRSLHTERLLCTSVNQLLLMGSEYAELGEEQKMQNF